MYKCPKCKTKFTNLNYNFCAACGCDIRDQAEKFINQKIKEMRPHALHGNPQVQFELGDYLQKVKTGGRLREAARWFLAAAEAGDDDAQWRLAACYWAGLGVEMNIETASIWLKQSADQGNAAALCCLAASGGGLSDRQQAFAWTIRAAALGYGWAQYLAGLNYARGEGTAKNPLLAAMWLCRAIDKDEPSAMKELAGLLKSLGKRPKSKKRRAVTNKHAAPAKGK